MNLEQVKEFVAEVYWGMLATSDGRKVGVRPMGHIGNRNKNSVGYGKFAQPTRLVYPNRRRM
jgi:hypothetical protein